MTQQSKGRFANTLIFYNRPKQPARNLVVAADSHVFINSVKDTIELSLRL